MTRRKRFDAALEKARVAASSVREAMDDIEGLKDEWREWYENMPENFQVTALGEKLEEVSELDLFGLENAADEIDSAVDELEATDLPLGWGRD